jgi:hypothetical protein
MTDPLLDQAKLAAVAQYRQAARDGVDHDHALDHALDAFLGVLRTAGRYVEPSDGPRVLTDDDAAKLAQFLAGKSRHPRYIESADGWQLLLDSEHNVEHAFSEAKRRSGDPSEAADLAAARTALVDWHTRLART